MLLSSIVDGHNRYHADLGMGFFWISEMKGVLQGWANEPTCDPGSKGGRTVVVLLGVVVEYG